jgi:spore maturation protein CgeB
MNIVFLGLSLTSSWGNGHATTYRALIRALAARGHDVVFLERDAPWYADNRDLFDPPYCRVRLYADFDELSRTGMSAIAEADIVVVGSYVPDGIRVADFVLETARGCTAFYDIDTPITLAALRRGDASYIARQQIPRFDLYLSFAGGPTLRTLERLFGARRARPLYCSVDADAYDRDPAIAPDHDLGYLGTYSADRQGTLDRLLIEPARRWPAGRFLIAGPQYPALMACPSNVGRITHLAPARHRTFYNRMRFTLNVTRRDMVLAGHSPSVRLFEAAACGTPIISDEWPGLADFFTPGDEILLARSADDVLGYLRELPEDERRQLGDRARERVLQKHTAAHRAGELEQYVSEANAGQPLAAVRFTTTA